MKQKEQFDVVVVGAGVAASASAITAVEKGARVLMIEKAPKSEAGGNGRYTGGGFRIVHKGNEELHNYMTGIPESQRQLIDVKEYTEDEFYSDIMRVTNGMADDALTEMVVKESNNAFKWVDSLNLGWDVNYDMATRVGDRMVFTQGAIPLNVQGGGEGFVDKMIEVAIKKGVEVRFETRAAKLLVDEDGAVCGVRTYSKGEGQDIYCKSVILAAGGFSANAEMRARYLGKGWDLVKVRGSKHNTGEVLRMALEAGAQPTGEWSGSHCTQIDLGAADVGGGLSTDRKSYTFGILVNTNGQRFFDEGEDFHGYTYAKLGRITREQPNGIAFQIFDSKVFDLLMSDYSHQTPVEANTIEELAEQLDIPVEALKKTVDEYNAAVQEGPFNQAERDGKHTSGLAINKSNWAQKIDKAPFRAYPVTSGITFTFGGVKVNKNGQVLDVTDKPIKGLYANGEMVGGFYIGNYPGGSGIVRNLVLGRKAGKHAAALAGGMVTTH